MKTLAELPRARAGVWVVAIETLLQRLAPRSYIEAHSLKVHVGERLDLEALRERLTLAGYAAVTQVVAHGEFAVRGSLLDVFPMGSDSPFRIDLLDQDIDSIRLFDPDTQRSGEKLERIQLLAARETPLSPDAVREFRRRYRLRFPGDLTEQAVYRDVSAGHAPGGIEFYLPLFFERTSHLLEYLPPTSILIDMHEASEGVDKLWNGIVERHEQLRHDRQRPILDPDEVYLPPAEFRALFAAWPRIELRSFEWPPETAGQWQNFPSVAPAAVRVDPRAEQPAAELAAHIESAPGRVLLAAESAGRRELLLELLRGRGIQPKIFEDFAAFVASDLKLGMTVSAAVSGLRLETPPLEILTESLLFGDRARQERRRRRSERDPAKILKELPICASARPWCTRPTASAATSACRPWTSPATPANFWCSSMRTATSCTCPCRRCTSYRAIPARRPRLRRCTSSAARNGRRRAAKRRNAFATWPPSCSTCIPAVPLARAPRWRRPRPDYRGFQAGFRFEETADQAAAIDQVLADMKSGKAHGPGHLRRRGLRQDRGRVARRLRGRGRRQAGGACSCRRRCSPSSTTRPSSIASPIGRCASRACRAFAPPRKRPQ